MGTKTTTKALPKARKAEYLMVEEVVLVVE
jgi:hypothetical protein